MITPFEGHAEPKAATWKAWMLGALRLAAAGVMAVWVGGFMFYGGVVEPILEDELGRLQAGMITRRVTDGLNLAGVAAVAIGATLALAEARWRPRRVVAARAVLLTLSAAMLGGLFALHLAMDRHLDLAGLRGFRPMHQAYLIVSTAQWAANVAIVAATIALWTGRRAASPGPGG